MSEIEIDRQNVKAVFKAYTDKYDVGDEKIRLKVEHTYRVADLCETIAKNLGMSVRDTDLAWLIGMLHDIGRFEQLRVFGTFLDADSIDHAHYGVEILFDDGKILDYLKLDNNSILEPGFNDGFMEIIKKAIWNHSAYKIENGLEEREKLFCNIIRDADKIDIFRVMDKTPMDAIYNVDEKTLRNAEVSVEVMDAFMERHAVLGSLRKTPADYIVGHAALAFELVFPISLAIAKKQGYLEKMINFKSENEVTEKQFEKIREVMHEYISSKK